MKEIEIDNRKDITVVVPCHRGGVDILPKVHKLVGFHNIILVEDGGTPIDTIRDNTKVIRSDINRGTLGCRLYGLEFVKTKYVTFLDEDDWIDFDILYSIKLKNVKEMFHIIDDLTLFILHGNIYNTEYVKKIWAPLKGKHLVYSEDILQQCVIKCQQDYTFATYDTPFYIRTKADSCFRNPIVQIKKAMNDTLEEIKLIDELGLPEILKKKFLYSWTSRFLLYMNLREPMYEKSDLKHAFSLVGKNEHFNTLIYQYMINEINRRLQEPAPVPVVDINTELDLMGTLGPQMDLYFLMDINAELGRRMLKSASVFQNDDFTGTAEEYTNQVNKTDDIYLLKDFIADFEKNIWFLIERVDVDVSRIHCPIELQPGLIKSLTPDSSLSALRFAK
jgi:glycosyltransferase involved in cell wall biosynthesis